MSQPPPPLKRRKRPAFPASDASLEIDSDESTNQRVWLIALVVVAILMLLLALLICVSAGIGLAMVGDGSGDHVARNDRGRNTDDENAAGGGAPEKDISKKNTPGSSRPQDKPRTAKPKTENPGKATPDASAGDGTRKKSSTRPAQNKGQGEKKNGGPQATQRRSSKFVDDDDDSLVRGGFFGVQDDAGSYVYVVDVSTSMKERGRYDKARKEVLNSVKALTARQKFCVIFYSSYAFHMLGKRNPTMVEPTTANLRKLEQWMKDFPVGGATQPLDALLKAIQLNPEVIFFLTDGEFQGTVASSVKTANRKPIRINTIGFQTTKGEYLMKKIASESGGVYKYVK